ncbi:MAG: hypothetical protein ABIK19_06265 [candidate division WOR-3 bacterium]
MPRFPKFCSPEWQKMKKDEIMFKTINRIPLNKFDKAFIILQQEYLAMEQEKAKKKLKEID